MTSIQHNPADFEPSSTEELATFIQAAQRNGKKVLFRNDRFGTQSEGTTVSLDRLSQLIDYPARDMTITVEAGMTIKRLQQILAAENQQLPIDFPSLAASIGSMVASDVAGPRQYFYGTLRDYLIGFEAIDGQGRIFHAGGRVVKNVAGYDLCRLMVGSQGRLGALTKLTFKLKPQPERSQILILSIKSTVLNSVLNSLNLTQTHPILIDLVSEPGSGCDDVDLYVGFEGSAATCSWQAKTLMSELSEIRAEVKMTGESEAIDSHLEQWQPRSQLPTIKCLPSLVPQIVSELASEGLPVFAHAGSGILYVGTSENTERAKQACLRVTDDEQSVILKADFPDDVAKSDVVTQRLLAAFDPNGIFKT